MKKNGTFSKDDCGPYGNPLLECKENSIVISVNQVSSCLLKYNLNDLPQRLLIFLEFLFN